LNRIIEISKYNVMEKVKNRKPTIFSKFHYGSFGINPKYLVIWYLFEKDTDLEKAEANGLKEELVQLTLVELRANGYPETALDEIQIAFTTDEDIQRETNGNYYYYFK